MTDSSTPTTASSSRPGTRNGTTSRTELLEARKRQLLEKNATTFGQRQARSHEVAGRVHVKPYVVPEPPPSSQASRTARFHPGQIFRDASPPRESHTGLPAIPSVRRRLAADQQTADKPNGLLGSCSSSPRYLARQAAVDDAAQHRDPQRRRPDVLVLQQRHRVPRGPAARVAGAHDGPHLRGRHVRHPARGVQEGAREADQPHAHPVAAAARGG
eukprot:CAMPEP_0174833952 /NCGR_PEP_ID=MMETSP1114-20130205/4545_1 /TAXON_ID=312471 /ORGANISM="Neobodo designis, Strain CCAP 1951/1" /LENGTH=214 /DNA_ID=CAMNT_0016067855 /DNA_START=146 /DNA_END=789 /DNA_ORIENTATION=+